MKGGHRTTRERLSREACGLVSLPCCNRRCLLVQHFLGHELLMLEKLAGDLTAPFDLGRCRPGALQQGFRVVHRHQKTQLLAITAGGHVHAHDAAALTPSTLFGLVGCALAIWMPAGPRITMNSAGRMPKINGNSRRTGAFAARSRASCRRFARTLPRWSSAP